MVLLGLAGLLLAGCSQIAESNSDELKDPHFLEGKRLATSFDYQGAVTSFEKALEANPRSASAHYELGLLFYKNMNDYAAAIYHFERFLRLRPTADNGEIIRVFITSSKQEIAKTVTLGAVSQQVRTELEKQMAENQRLKQQVEALQSQLALHSVATSNVAGMDPLPARTAVPQSQNSNKIMLAQIPDGSAGSARTKENSGKPATAGSRTYVVKSGDNPGKIAAAHNVKLGALMAANPNLDPKKLKPGQSIIVPGP